MSDTLIGREFGHYRLLEVVGASRNGRVFRAERTDGVRQTVAVKLLASELSAVDRARFEREAHMLARLAHPAVARMIDTGIDNGRSWIALEFIRGMPIDEYCDAKQLSVRERVRLLIQVVDAVAAAHAMLVVHRDVKPGNVLVNEAGLPKLIDFGIATNLEMTLNDRPPTVDVSHLFTPHYAAPEQVMGEPVTVVTDVFGLGALCFRILSGVPPYAGADDPVAYVLAVTREEAGLASEASRAGTNSRRRDALRGDLDAIIAKAMARDSKRRYASSADLSADLQRYLDNLPVEARIPAFGYRLSRFVKRNFVSVVAAGVLLAGVIVGTLLYSLQSRVVAQAQELAVRRGEFLENIIKSGSARPVPGDLTVAELLDSAAQQSRKSFLQEPLVGASLLGVLATTNAGLGRFKEALAVNQSQLALLRAHGGGRADLVDTLTQEGDLLNTTGKTQEAEPPLREALTLLRNRCDASAQFAAVTNVLGVVLTNSAREKEAESAYHQSIDCYRRAPPPLASKAADPLNNLQVLLGNEGRYADSLAAGREAVALMKTRVVADHPDLLGMQMNLAGTLGNLNDNTEAEAILRDVIAKRSHILGTDHLDTLNARTQLADSLYQQHRDSEAAAFELPTAQTLDRVAGVDHPWTLYAWALYGITACRGNHEEAGLKALRHVEEARIRLYGNNDWHTWSTRVSMGICMVVLSRYEEALPLLLHAAAALESDRGAKFARTQAAFEALHDLYVARGNVAEAARWQGRLNLAGAVP